MTNGASERSCPPHAECMERLGRIETVCEGQSKKLDHLCNRLLGNGGDGLVVDVDRLKQTSKRLTWWLGSLATATIAVGGTLLAWLLTNRPPAG